MKSVNKEYILFEKRVSETPLQTLTRLRDQYPELKNSKLAYAGRLDPQASGEMLILIAEGCKRRDHYQKLDKIYTFDLLLGIATDTGDIMGLPTSVLHSKINISETEISATLTKFTGEQVQTPPLYSSQRFQGKALWQLAKKETPVDLTQLARKIHIYSLELISHDTISNFELWKDAVNRISSFDGNFRIQEMLKAWRLETDRTKVKEFPYFKIKAHVSSGTYIRQLGIDIGRVLGLPAMCWHIHRDKIILN